MNGSKGFFKMVWCRRVGGWRRETADGDLCRWIDQSFLRVRLIGFSLSSDGHVFSAFLQISLLFAAFVLCVISFQTATHHRLGVTDSTDWISTRILPSESSESESWSITVLPFSPWSTCSDATLVKSSSSPCAHQSEERTRVVLVLCFLLRVHLSSCSNIRFRFRRLFRSFFLAPLDSFLSTVRFLLIFLTSVHGMWIRSMIVMREVWTNRWPLISVMKGWWCNTNSLLLLRCLEMRKLI